jgi:hypothetical protein
MTLRVLEGSVTSLFSWFGDDLCELIERHDEQRDISVSFAVLPLRRGAPAAETR